MHRWGTGGRGTLGGVTVPGTPLERRRFLAVLAGGLGVGALAACTSPSSSAAAQPSASPSSSAASASATATAGSPSTSATPGSTASAALPASTAWVARSGEVEPAVKRVATSLVQAVAAWPAGQGGLAAARRRVAALGLPASLADACAPLLGAGEAASCRIVDAQYGGILSSSSSVLVVVDQWRLGADGRVTAGGTTLDVRLVEAAPRWRVVAVHPAAPGRSTATPSGLVRAVLAEPRIRLPYAARADVATGAIAASVLRTLQALAESHVVDVSVVRSGHPLYVFGTSRPSDHPKGHAVDVWALDGRPLVVPSNHGLAVTGMRLAVANGAYNVGGPVQLSGSTYFSDLTHHDHIHLGFRG